MWSENKRTEPWRGTLFFRCSWTEKAQAKGSNKTRLKRVIGWFVVILYWGYMIHPDTDKNNQQDGPLYFVCLLIVCLIFSFLEVARSHGGQFLFEPRNPTASLDPPTACLHKSAEFHRERDH